MVSRCTTLHWKLRTVSDQLLFGVFCAEMRLLFWQPATLPLLGCFFYSEHRSAHNRKLACQCHVGHGFSESAIYHERGAEHNKICSRSIDFIRFYQIIVLMPLFNGLLDSTKVGLYVCVFIPMKILLQNEQLSSSRSNNPRIEINIRNIRRNINRGYIERNWIGVRGGVLRT